MPSNYRYPGKSDFESVSKQGNVSDVNAASLYREKMDQRIVGCLLYTSPSPRD